MCEADLRRERLRERNDSRNEQFDISPETCEQELRPVVCEQRETDRFRENYHGPGINSLNYR